MANTEKKGVIYILQNPAFKEYVKIGYAHDIEKRLHQLNRSDNFFPILAFVLAKHSWYRLIP